MSHKTSLTHKQERVLGFLKDFLHRHGYPPTVREIAHHLKMAGPHSAKRFLDMLEQKGYIRRIAKSSRAIEIIDKPSPPLVRIVPLVGRVRAGTPLLALENVEGTISLDHSLARWNDVFLLRVIGDSMIEAHIKEGDLALVKPQPTAENGEIVVALVNDEATIKRFFKKGDTICLEPANASMVPIRISLGDADVNIVGKVVGLLRNIEGTILPCKREQSQ
jgi:repressor LexA